MLRKAVYKSESGKLTVELERINVLIKSEDEIVNFPRIIELGGQKLILPYGRG